MTNIHFLYAYYSALFELFYMILVIKNMQHLNMHVYRQVYQLEAERKMFYKALWNSQDLEIVQVIYFICEQISPKSVEF